MPKLVGYTLASTSPTLDKLRPKKIWSLYPTVPKAMEAARGILEALPNSLFEGLNVEDRTEERRVNVRRLAGNYVRNFNQVASLELRMESDRRHVAQELIPESVEVDGKTYTRLETVNTYGDWQPDHLELGVLITIHETTVDLSDDVSEYTTKETTDGNPT